MKLINNISLLNDKIFDIYLETTSENIKSILKGNTLTKDLPELEKLSRNKTNQIFNEKFREEEWINAISNTITGYSNLAKILGYGQIYQSFSNYWATWNNNFLEPIRDTFWRTPSNKIGNFKKYSLFHYDRTAYNDSDGITTYPTIKTPILMVYAFINRHYILDLLPEVSVVRNFLKQGFDVYATDWGILLHMIRT